MGLFTRFRKLPLVVGFATIILATTAGISSVNAADKPIKIKVLSSWGTDQTYTKLFLVPWVERINKRSKGRIEASWVGPEAVPPFEQLLPLSTGLFDILYTVSAYHTGEVAIAVAMDLVKGKVSDKRAAGFFEVLDQGYEKINAKVLGLNALGIGYTVMLKKEINKADFSGLKLRTTPSYEPMVKALNGASVRLSTPENYSALEKGVVDGVCQTALSSIDLKLYEVAKYQLRPLYGEVTQIFLANLDSWSSWPKDVQDLMIEVTKELEEESRQKLIEYYDGRIADLVKNKELVLNDLPEAEAAKLRNTYYDKSWEEILFKFEPKLAPKMKAIADKFVSTHPQN